MTQDNLVTFSFYLHSNFEPPFIPKEPPLKKIKVASSPDETIEWVANFDMPDLEDE